MKMADGCCLYIYTFDEATGNILIDLYEIEQEAIRRMEKAYPKKKVDSIYVT